MSKWRPAEKNAVYVIPDIHGMHKELQLILKRILPLRRSEGCKDTLFFLGDYVDRRCDSHLVIDTLIELKKLYPNQVFMIKGNHEDMMLRSMQLNTSGAYQHRLWMSNGGVQTLFGYLERAGINDIYPGKIERQRLSSIIPKEHQEFLKNLPVYLETKEFIFVHGGCDPMSPLINQDKGEMMWDRSLYQICCARNLRELPWEKCVVTGHNGQADGQLLIRDKFMMLDRNAVNELICTELRSMEAMVAKEGKKRLVSFDFSSHII